VKFADRVLLLPSLAGLLFLGALLVNETTGRANARLVEAIEHDYAPALQVCSDAQAALLDVQRALQDAVTAGDPLRLREADGVSRHLLEVLEAGRQNPGLDEIPSVETAYALYYDGARTTSLRLIGGEGSDRLQPDIVRMMLTQTGRLVAIGVRKGGLQRLQVLRSVWRFRRGCAVR